MGQGVGLTWQAAQLLCAVLLLSLVACPAGLLVESFVYPDVPSLSPTEPWPDDPPPQRLAEALLIAHACLSLAAAVAVYFLPLARSWRVVAWLGIVFWLYVTFLFVLNITIAKTGKYL